MKEVRTTTGARLVSPGILKFSPRLLVGPTVDGMSFTNELAEWVELKWQVLDPARAAQTSEWDTLDRAAGAAYFDAQRALPVKSERVPVRSLVPSHVIEEVLNSPARTDVPSLRLKSMWFYLIWTDAGVKLHWEVRQGCCTVLHGAARGRKPYSLTALELTPGSSSAQPRVPHTLRSDVHCRSGL